LRAEIKRIQDEGVSAEELARVKTQSIAAQIYKRDSLMAQAMEIGGRGDRHFLARHRPPAGKAQERDGGRSAGGGEEILQGRHAEHRRARSAADRKSKPKKPSGAVRH
jgi:hypothetical protein